MTCQNSKVKPNCFRIINMVVTQGITVSDTEMFSLPAAIEYNIGPDEINTIMK